MEMREIDDEGFKPFKKWCQSNKRGEAEERQQRKERESSQI